MKRLIDSLMGAVRRFGVFDFAVFKLALLGAGVLLGAYFSSFFLTWSTIVWAGSAVHHSVLQAGRLYEKEVI